MPSWRVELRAWLDTPQEEEYARRQGRVLGPQSVVYPAIWADTYEEACRLATEREMSFLYRRHVVIFDAKQVMRLGCDCCYK